MIEISQRGRGSALLEWGVDTDGRVQDFLTRRPPNIIRIFVRVLSLCSDREWWGFSSYEIRGALLRCGFWLYYHNEGVLRMSRRFRKEKMLTGSVEGEK